MQYHLAIRHHSHTRSSSLVLLSDAGPFRRTPDCTMKFFSFTASIVGLSTAFIELFCSKYLGVQAGGRISYISPYDSVSRHFLLVLEYFYFVNSQI